MALYWITIASIFYFEQINHHQAKDPDLHIHALAISHSIIKLEAAQNATACDIIHYTIHNEWKGIAQSQFKVKERFFWSTLAWHTDVTDRRQRIKKRMCVSQMNTKLCDVLMCITCQNSICVILVLLILYTSSIPVVFCCSQKSYIKEIKLKLKREIWQYLQTYITPINSLHRKKTFWTWKAITQDRTN